MDQPKRRLSAVWFADIVGYTPLSARDETMALRLIGELQPLARSIVEQEFEGRIVKFIGDAVLAEFSSTESAVRAAVTLQERYSERADATGFPSQLRTGVHLGEVVATSDGDLYGDGINTAARLQKEAAPGQVIVSEDVWRQLRQRPEFRFESLGGLELKGISTRVDVYNVLFGARAALTPSSAAPSATGVQGAGRRPRGALAAIAAAVALVAGLSVWMIRSPQPASTTTVPPTSPPATLAPPPAQAPEMLAPTAAAPSPPTTLSQPSAQPPPAPPARTGPDASPRVSAAPERAGAPATEARELGAEPAAVRALLEEFIAAIEAADGLADIRRLFPSIRPPQVRALVTMRQQMGRDVTMKLGPVENRGPEGDGLNIRFVVLASNGARQMPLTFDANIGRQPGGWRFLRLQRVQNGQPGAAR